jgi:hypothetical protein
MNGPDQRFGDRRSLALLSVGDGNTVLFPCVDLTTLALPPKLKRWATQFVPFRRALLEPEEFAMLSATAARFGRLRVPARRDTTTNLRCHLARFFALAVMLGLAPGMAPARDEEKIKISDCPASVRKTFESEAKGVKLDKVTKEKNADDETLFWADVSIGGKMYAIGVLEDGTLTEMNLAVDDEELPFERCPALVQATMRHEAFGQKVGSVGKDMKYGVSIYETVVPYRGHSYQIVVAEDGMLVEKVLIIEDDEIELEKCPTAVQTALRAHSGGGKIGAITRSTGIGKATFEAEVEIKNKVYLIEVAESGLLISKSLEAGAD